MKPIPVERVTIVGTDLDHWTRDERCMFVQTGIVLMDLRFVGLQLARHVAFFLSKSKPHPLEASVLLSQMTLLFGQVAGVMCEANNIIRKSYYSTKLSAKYASLLEPAPREALGRIKAYFGKTGNLATLFRNNFAFHYDRDRIVDIMEDSRRHTPDRAHNVFFTDILNDTVFEFAQEYAMNALFKATGKLDALAAFRHAYEDLVKLQEDVHVFFHGLLQAMSRGLPEESEKFTFQCTPHSPALFWQMTGVEPRGGV